MSIHANLRITSEQVAARLRELGIKPTKRNVGGVTEHLRLIALAWAKAALQDLTKEDAEFYTSDEWINDEEE